MLERTHNSVRLENFPMKLRNTTSLLALLVFTAACEDKAEAPFREAEKAYAEQRFSIPVDTN